MSQFAKSKEAEYRENQISTEFLTCPYDDVTRVFINGQLTSAENFPQAELFVSYRVSLPVGWKTEISEEYQSLDLSPQELKELNCLDSITQSTLPVIQRNKDGGITTKFYFCFPIDLQLLVKDKTVEWPTIHLQVFSKDIWDRILMHGCGFVVLPSKAGYHQLSVETWRPVADLKTKISEFFLGGLIKVKDIEDISKSQKLNQLDQPGPVNRFQYNTLSSGTVNLALNIVTQSKKVKTDERVLYRDQKFSEETEQKKKQFQQPMPSFVNTGSVLGGRFTNTNL